MGNILIAVVSAALLALAWFKVRSSRPVAQAVPAGGLAFATEGAGGAAPEAHDEPVAVGRAAPPPDDIDRALAGADAGRTAAPSTPPPAPSHPVADADGEPLPADVVALGLTVPFPHLSSDEYLGDLSVGDLFLHAAGSADGECDATEVMLSMARDELRSLRSLAMESTDEGRALRSLGRKLDVAYELHRRAVAALRGDK